MMLNTIGKFHISVCPCIILYVTSRDRGYDDNDHDSDRDGKQEKTAWPADFGRRTYVCVKKFMEHALEGKCWKG